MITAHKVRPNIRKSFPVTALLGVTAACWAYLFLLRAETGAMGSSRSVFAMPMTSAWTTGQMILMWTMWAVMMAAMMIPSAMPMILAYNATVKPASTDPTTSRSSGSTGMFVTGYLLAWSGFAALATTLQWLLHDAALVDAMGVSTSRWVAGPVLFTAGVYQFSPVKDACLGKCRTPLGFLLSEWRSGRMGGLVMGLHHGSICIGCCWALMALLFVLGVMNLWWIVLVATVVLVEKLARSTIMPKALGVVMVLWGLFVLIGVINTGVTV